VTARRASEARESELSLLLRILDEGYEKRAWHGPNLKGSLRGVTVRQAAWRPAPGRHSIRDLVRHAAYWKYANRRRLTGEKRGSFPLAGSNWFPEDAPATEKAWRADIAMLDEQHRRLRDVIRTLPPKSLAERSRGSRYRIDTLVYGIAAHDVYHTGQIQLLKRLYRHGPRRGSRG
jgi:uncharacterized damage-inducible protein DinB